MRFEKSLGLGLLTAGLTLGWAGLSRGQDKPRAEPPPPGAERGERPQRGGPDGGGEGRPRMELGQQMLDRLHEQLKKLNLSDEQSTKIKAILDEAKTATSAAMKEGEGLEPRERFGKVREVMQPFREKLMDVLDETQREKLRENMKAAGGPGFGGPGGPEGRRGPGGPPPPGGERDGRRAERRGPGGPDGPGRPGEPRGPGGPDGQRRPEPGMMIERMRHNLERLELTAEQKSKVDALLSETEKKLIDLRTEAEKQAVETRGKFRAAIDESRSQIEALLTDEQKAKLKEMASPRPPRGEGERPGGPGPRPDRGAPGAPPPPKE